MTTHAPADTGTTTTPELLTVAEVATHLRVSTMTVRRWIDAGDLPAVKVGRQRRVAVDDLNAYLQAAGTSSWRVSTPAASGPRATR